MLYSVLKLYGFQHTLLRVFASSSRQVVVQKFRSRQCNFLSDDMVSFTAVDVLGAVSAPAPGVRVSAPAGISALARTFAAVAAASSVGNSVGQYSFGGSLTWEIDVWGKLRRAIESSSAAAQASAADLAAARLSASAE